MLKTSLLGAGVIILAACASNPAAAPRTATASAQGSSGPRAGCLNKSATRLPSPMEDCTAFGHSLSADALKSTGGPTTQDALRLLDPTVTVHP
jgi:hypothetical protein